MLSFGNTTSGLLLKSSRAAVTSLSRANVTSFDEHVLNAVAMMAAHAREQVTPRVVCDLVRLAGVTQKCMKDERRQNDM